MFHLPKALQFAAEHLITPHTTEVTAAPQHKHVSLAANKMPCE